MYFKSRLLWDSLMLAFIWVVWIERNERIFANNFRNDFHLFNSILFFVEFWTGALQSSGTEPVSSLALVQTGKSFARFSSARRDRGRLSEDVDQDLIPREVEARGVHLELSGGNGEVLLTYARRRRNAG